MKNIFLGACIMMLSFTFASCKKDDTKSTTSSTTSSTATTATTSTTATTATTSTTATTGTTSATDPNTLIFEGTVVNNLTGNCEYSDLLTVTGEVTTADGTNYFIAVDFSIAEPNGTYTTVLLPADPVGETQCHMQVTRTKGSYVLAMLAPTGASVKVVKNGMKYTISFDKIDFSVKKGGNGVRSISCTGFGC